MILDINRLTKYDNIYIMGVKIKRENGGHAKFAFQKVVVPLSFLIVVTIIFWLITM